MTFETANVKKGPSLKVQTEVESIIILCSTNALFNPYFLLKFLTYSLRKRKNAHKMNAAGRNKYFESEGPPKKELSVLCTGRLPARRRYGLSILL